MNKPQSNSPRARLQQLQAIPERQRTEEEWDELNELEIMFAAGNRDTGQGHGHGNRDHDRGNRDPGALSSYGARGSNPQQQGQGQRKAEGGGGGPGGGGRKGQRKFHKKPKKNNPNNPQR
ncbi:MAG TPA: hypothetical protein VHP37_25185 [Burkholderiales bacterium]|nr:hypothetical protein [Burkholderiales bacterium]